MPGYGVVDARVAVGAPRIPELEDPAYASCARTVLRAGGDGTRFDVAVVAGGTAAPRGRLLRRLDARL